MIGQTHYPCPRCFVGHLKADHATYAGVIQGMLLSVPNMPAWTCDVCQHHEFDEAALIQIEALVGQTSLQDESNRPSAKRPPMDNDSTTPSRHRLKS